jgi:hypothetical protein
MNEGWRATRELSYTDQAIRLRHARALHRSELHEMERIKRELAAEDVVPTAIPSGVLTPEELRKLQRSRTWVK